jgi:ABC-type nickel/cobalt efflux system permease component RcnA
VKEAFSSAPMELKGFYTMAAGTVVQILSSATFMQVVGFIVAVAGLIVQLSAWRRNRAETKRAQEDTRLRAEAAKREQEMHEAKMHFMRRELERVAVHLADDSPPAVAATPQKETHDPH